MLSKWWGWGEEGKEYRLPDPKRFRKYLRARPGPTEAVSRIDSLEGVHLPPSRLPAAAAGSDLVQMIAGSDGTLGERGVVMAHLSHPYNDGGSIYYTSLAAQKRGGEIEQWEKVKMAAMQAIAREGGALSHHHGIGSDHMAWMESYLGRAGAQLLSGLKSALDPGGVMNPGKLVPELSQEANAPLAGSEAGRG